MGIAYAIARNAMRQSGASAAQRQDNAEDAAKAAYERAEREAEQKAADKLADRLDEAASFIRRYVWMTQAEADAMALVAAATWVTEPGTLVSAPRVLFVSPEHGAGKSVALRVVTSLSYNPVDTAGTWYDTKSAIFEAHTSGEPCPTLFRDEISEIFGRAGLSGAGNPLGDILRRGYVAGAEIGQSVNRTSDRASIFSTFFMTGLRVAIPEDIKSRSIVIHMQRAPEGEVEYFDLRDAAAEAAETGDALKHAVRGNRDYIAAFRVRSLRQRHLSGRRAEVWEGAFAVAAAASQDWLNRARDAFIELATDEANEQALSPREALVRDLALAAEKVMGEAILHNERRFVTRRVLRDELRHMDPDYAVQTESSLSRRMLEAVPGISITVSGKTYRGYYAEDLDTAWERVRPAPKADVELPAEADPWADDEE